MRPIRHPLVLAVLVLLLPATLPAATPDPNLPPNPADWVCADPEPPVDPKTWCETQRTRRKPASFPVEPVLLDDVAGKNAWDTALKQFLIDYQYRETTAGGAAGLDWYGDLSWRLTGPIVGDLPSDGSFTGKTYGVHPAVRIYYSPEVVDWLCGDRQGEVAPGGMIIKEMRNLDATPIAAPDGCMEITEEVDPQSWTVMVKGDGVTHDGWYWANPTNSPLPNPPACPQRQAFPDFLDASAVTDPGFWDADCRPDTPPTERLEDWYPTGLGSGRWSNVYPWSLFGAYCLNCHASAESELTYASLDNVLTTGLRYKNFPQTVLPLTPLLPAREATMRHAPAARSAAKAAAPASPYPSPLDEPLPAFTDFYGDTLEPASYEEIWKLRFPSETRDHHPAVPGMASRFLTSDQCIGCHDATVSNDETPNMVVTVGGTTYNVSPYAEWRASPMGLAGRDPIFFAQLESEVLNLPELGPCIENTCLHCHGVMGQRQFASDHPGGADAPCKSDIFVLDPPAGVPFGAEPYRREWLEEWQSSEPHADYAALSRDGISCTVCHRIDAQSLKNGEPGYTGNFVTPDSGDLFGPYADDTVVTQPMLHAIDRTPVEGSQISDSGLCNTCHNILLPLFDNDGQPHYYEAPDGSKVRAKYEQTTGLEWQNSDFAQGDTFQSCQDCHMPQAIADHPLAGTEIANIEDSGFAPTTHRLPDAEITLTPRPTFARHALHGLNLFLNQMFQQFPILLGFRQIDYMNSSTQPALITGQESMLDMARNQTASVEITNLETKGDRLEVTVLVTNEAGHFLPSGVGFRRVFVELQALDEAGDVLFASGLTNELGVIVDYSPATCTTPGDVDTCRPIAGENFYQSETAYQPHYQTIDSTSQAQIYQELIKDSAGHFTTSFLRRIDDVKDNRLRAKGYDPAVFAKSESPYIQELAHPIGNTAEDPYYTDPKLTGADEVVYSIPLEGGKPAEVRVALYSQSIPPFYLQQRFRDAKLASGPAAQADIQRLYYAASRLNTQGKNAADASGPIEEWKVRLGGDGRSLPRATTAPRSRR